MSALITHRKGINMIFDILTHNFQGEELKEPIFKETKVYDALEMFDWLRAAGFQDVYICCAHGYENGLIFTHLP